MKEEVICVYTYSLRSMCDNLLRQSTTINVAYSVHIDYFIYS